MAAKYRIYAGRNKKTYWQLKSPNGQVILQSQGYASKSSARNGIESVRKNCGTETRFETKTAKNGELYFTLVASNGQVIGTSETYKSSASCRNGIESVMKNGTTTQVEDDTAG